MDLSNLMMLWNFLLAFYIVYADVIREDGYHNYEGQFTVENKGRMLRVLMSFRNLKSEECALYCVRHLRCRTYNYQHVTKDCELTDEEFDGLDADTITLGWHNYGTPKRVNGGWSSWRNFTECTKTCGNGTRDQYRECDSPTPAHGGAECKGKMTRRIKCNIRGCPIVNVALGKVATQTSTFIDHANYSPSKAVDGDSKTSAWTKYVSNSWWEVDLGDVKVIKEMRLTAHLDFIFNEGLLVETRTEIGDSWKICYNVGDIKHFVTSFQCHAVATKARFVRIRSTKTCYLRFYEVEIFGF